MFKMIALILTFIEIAHSLSYISDSNISQITQLTQITKNNNKIIFTFLSTSHEDLLRMKTKLNLEHYSKQEEIIMIGLLGNNKHLQKQYNIKRHPYFGAIINSIHYGMPDVISQSSIQKFIKKIRQYHSFITNNDTECQYKYKYKQKTETNVNYVFVKIDGLDSIGLSEKELFEKYMLNPVFYSVEIKACRIWDHEYDILTVINSQEEWHKFENAQSLHQILTRAALQSVNEFSQPIFTALTSITSSQQRLMFLAGFDTNKKESINYKAVLQSAMSEFPNSNIYVFWMQSEINKEKKKALGFSEHESPPLFAFFDPENGQHYKMPALFTKENIIQHIANVRQSKQIQVGYSETRVKLSRDGIETLTLNSNDNDNKNKKGSISEQYCRILKQYLMGKQNIAILVYITFEYSQQEVKWLHWVINRLNRFRFGDQIKIIASPYAEVQGRVVGGKESRLLIRTIKQAECVPFEGRIGSDSMAHELGRALGDLPPNWQVEEESMLKHLQNCQM